MPSGIFNFILCQKDTWVIGPWLRNWVTKNHFYQHPLDPFWSPTCQKIKNHWPCLAVFLVLFAGCLWEGNSPLQFLGIKHRYFYLAFLDVEKKCFHWSSYGGLYGITTTRNFPFCFKRENSLGIFLFPLFPLISETAKGCVSNGDAESTCSGSTTS